MLITDTKFEEFKSIHASKIGFYFSISDDQEQFLCN